MSKHVIRLYGKLPNTNVEIDININGKTLIITGVNGSGKTYFLQQMYIALTNSFNTHNSARIEALRKAISETEALILSDPVYYSKGQHHFEMLKEHKSHLKAFQHDLIYELSEPGTLYKKYINKSAIVSIFDAGRTAKIDAADGAKGIDSEKEQFSSSMPEAKVGSKLEQHLVNLRNRMSLAITEDGDIALSESIKNWFAHFENQLKLIMEDHQATLKFNTSTLSFTIMRPGKPPTSFQTLSSGHSAIFDIYSELLMRTQYFEITPDALTGVVFIDEIEAHLHVSLQRTILPFFKRSFPKIQFIVTTHSPFVLTSTDDTTIFDLANNEQIEKDISLYSYSSVMEGLLGTKPTSIILDDTIAEISEASTNQSVDINRLNALLLKVKSSYNELDTASKASYLFGLNVLQDEVQANVPSKTSD